MKRNADLYPNPAVADAGVIIGSDLTVDGKRFVYLRAYARFDPVSGDMVTLDEAGISALLESCGLTVLRVRPLCVADEYSVTIEDGSAA